MSCFASGNGSCYACKKDSLNVEYFLVYGTTICSDTCLDGTYSNVTSYKCHLCDSNCLTCSGNSKFCTSCGFTNFGTVLFLENNKCVQDCKGNYFE